MSQQTIGIGTVANDGTGDPLRTSFNKANLNFTELYTGLGGVLAKSGVSSAHTGDTIEAPLATISIPANTLGANGVIKVTAFFSCTSSANNKSFRFRLGGSGITGTVINSGTTITTLSGFQASSVTICANATNAQNTQGWADRGNDHLQANTGVVASAIDMTTGQNLVMTGQLALGTETISLIGYVVEFIL